MKFHIIQPPDVLKNDVECFRIGEYTGEEGFAITVSLNGLPGLVFQHHNGQSPIESITTSSQRTCSVPTLYIYGQTTEVGVLHHRPGPYTMTQVILKPHALNSLLGINASLLTNNMVELHEFSAGNLNTQLLEAHSQQERIALLTNFLLTHLKREKRRDKLVEAGVHLIHRHSGSITVKQLLNHLHLSERQFEKRFSQTVGLAPQFYIRVKRFNAAIRLMQTGQYARLTDVAHALNFYDQSHFIRDIKAFSGITPKTLSQKVDDFHAEQPVYAYV